MPLRCPAAARTGRALLLTLMLAGLPALAAAQPFLTATQVDLARLLAPPPETGSAQQQAEMAVLQQYEATRTPERIAQAVKDVDESVFAMFGTTLGPAFNPGALPLAAHLFDRLGDTEETLSANPKGKFARLRPFLANPALHPPGPTSRSGSYPSGHATRSTIIGVVLAAMVPEQRGDIFARMADYAESRLVLGVHYPSDLAAGRIAGTAVDAVLFNDPGFLAAYAPARAEVRRALGLAP